MALITNTLTTHAEMERCFSSYGVTAFADHFKSGIRDDLVVDDCANQATAEVFNYATQRYSQTGLATHQTARSWATMLACYFLTIRRGNGPPDSFQLEFNRIMELMKLIPSGAYQLYGLAGRGDNRPTWSNLKVDRRHRHSTIRVTTPNSSDAPTVLTQDDLIEGPVPHD